MHNPTPTIPTNFSIAEELIFQHAASTSELAAYKMSYCHVCIFFFQPPTLAIYNCLLSCILLQVVAMLMLLLVAVNTFICAKYEIHNNY